MLFSSFCWHNEDNFLFSINYLHEGAPKLWYGVPGASANIFEEAMRTLNPTLFARTPHLLMGLVTATPPGALAALGVPLVRAVQNAGDVIITFPRAYHGGFNLGVWFLMTVILVLISSAVQCRRSCELCCSIMVTMGSRSNFVLSCYKKSACNFT